LVWSYTNRCRWIKATLCGKKKLSVITEFEIFGTAKRMLPWTQLELHTYQSCFIPEGIAEASQILLRVAHVLPKHLTMSNTADVTCGTPIAVWSHAISGVRAINPLVTFYDIHGRKREVQIFYIVPDTTRGKLIFVPIRVDFCISAIVLCTLSMYIQYLLLNYFVCGI
jgi:hypothetical protein